VLAQTIVTISSHPANVQAINYADRTKNCTLRKTTLAKTFPMNPKNGCVEPIVYFGKITALVPKNNCSSKFALGFSAIVQTIT
jgi:hypothetical protein